MAEWAEDLFQVSIKGPGPYGFRLYGGDGDPLIVAKLRARSKAHDAGLREGDAVLGINGRSCQTVSHGVAMTLLETANEALHLHLYRGSTSRKTIAAVYNSIGNQLRPVSPGTAPPNRSAAAAQPPPAAGETVDSAAPPPPPAVEGEKRGENVTSSYSRQEVTSVGAGVTQKTTTETEDRGGVTVTKVTREVVISGGSAAPADGEPTAESGRGTVLFNGAPTTKLRGVKTLRWTPAGVGTKEHSPVHLEKKIFGVGELGGGGEPQQFKVYKTTAKRLIWQPSDVPSLPVREPSPAMTFEVLTQEFQPHPQKEEGSRPPRHSGAAVEGTDGSGDPFDLSPHLFHVLTTEGTYDEDFVLGRKKKIFANSSFYDDPEQKYPTIEEQIKMARKVALSLSAPDNVTARGQRMFMKRKEKANHWSTDQSLDGLNPYVPKARKTGRDQRDAVGGGGGGGDFYYKPHPWSVAAPSSSAEHEQAKQVVTEAIRDTTLLEGYPEDRGQSTASFAKNRALFEKREGDEVGGEPPGRKPPPRGSGSAGAQLYAGLVNDLKGMKGKGAKLFAQKRARALEEAGQEEEAAAAAAAVGGWQSEGETAGGPRERGIGGGEEYNTNQAPGYSTDVDDVSSARRLEELISISRKSYQNPWESKAPASAAAIGQAVLAPWQTAAAASEQHQARKGRADDAWLQQETADVVPGFIAQKTPSTSYRPVRFHIPSNGPGPGISDF